MKCCVRCGLRPAFGVMVEEFCEYCERDISYLKEEVKSHDKLDGETKLILKSLEVEMRAIKDNTGKLVDKLIDDVDKLKEEKRRRDG